MLISIHCTILLIAHDSNAGRESAYRNFQTTSPRSHPDPTSTRLHLNPTSTQPRPNLDIRLHLDPTPTHPTQPRPTRPHLDPTPTPPRPHLDSTPTRPRPHLDPTSTPLQTTTLRSPISPWVVTIVYWPPPLMRNVSGFGVHLQAILLPCSWLTRAWSRRLT